MRLLPVHREYIAIVHSSSGEKELKKVPFNIFEYALRKYLGFYSNTHFKNVYSKAFTDTLKNPSILKEIGKEQLEKIEKELEGVEKEKREKAKQIKLNKLIEESLYFAIFRKANDRKINAFIGKYQISGCSVKISGNYQWDFQSFPLIHSVNFQFRVDEITHNLAFIVKPIEGLSIPVQRIVSVGIDKSLDNTYETPTRIVVELPPLLFGEILNEDSKKLEERLLSKETAILMSVIRKMREDSKEDFYSLAKHHHLKKDSNQIRSEHMQTLGWKLIGENEEKIHTVNLKHDVYSLQGKINDKEMQQLPFLSLEFARQYLVPYTSKVRVSRLETNEQTNPIAKTTATPTTEQVDLMKFEGMENSETPGVLIEKTAATPTTEQIDLKKFEGMETSLI